MKIIKDGWIQLPQNLLKLMNWKTDDVLLFEQLEQRLLLYKKENIDESKLFIRCFGHFSIEYDSKEIIIKNKKLRELLAFLVLYNNELINKSTVAQQLWPNSSKIKAMDCLYKVLRFFKKTSVLTEKIPLEIYREQLRICISPNEADFLLFDKFSNSENLIHHLQALELYRGGFLEMECYEWSLLFQMKYEIKYENIKKIPYYFQ